MNTYALAAAGLTIVATCVVNTQRLTTLPAVVPSDAMLAYTFTLTLLAIITFFAVATRGPLVGSRRHLAKVLIFPSIPGAILGLLEPGIAEPTTGAIMAVLTVGACSSLPSDLIYRPTLVAIIPSPSMITEISSTNIHAQSLAQLPTLTASLTPTFMLTLSGMTLSWLATWFHWQRLTNATLITCSRFFAKEILHTKDLLLHFVNQGNVVYIRRADEYRVTR